MNGTHVLTGEDMQRQFAAEDVRMAVARDRCVALRAEHAEIMRTWPLITLTTDYEAIGKDAARLAEIGRELARLGG